MKAFTQSDCFNILLEQSSVQFDETYLPNCHPVQGSFIVTNFDKQLSPVDLIVSVDIYFELELNDDLEDELFDNIAVNVTFLETLTELPTIPLPSSGNLETGRRFSFRQEAFPYNYPQGELFKVLISISTPPSGLPQEFFVRVSAQEEGCPFNSDNLSSFEDIESIGFQSFPASISGLASALIGTALNNPPSGQSISIDGNLIFNVDYEFQTGASTYFSRTYLSQGASITVESGRTLKLFNMNILTCDYLARGIIVEPGATLIADNVNFRDSRFAIDARPGSRIDIRNSNFQNNYIGLNAQLAPGDAPIQLLGFANNTFTTTDGIKLPYAGMPEQVGAVGFAGIRAENNNDFNSWSPNTFDNLANGILLRNSNANLDNLTITNIVADAAYPVSGFGVNTISDNNTSFLILGRHGVSSFGGVGAAVGASGIGGEISNCLVTNAEVGITWVQSQNRDKILFNNNITARQVAINSFRCEPNIVAGNFTSRMQDNILTAPRGIIANESSATADGAGWRILDNNITVVNTAPNQTNIGINYGGGRNGWVNHNTITTSVVNALGIDALKLQNTTISINNTSGGFLGINLRSNNNCIVECNTPRQSQIGIRVFNNNPGVTIKTNRFGELTTGLEYGTSTLATGFTGTQLHQGNVWNNNTVQLGARHWDGVNAQNSGYIVDVPESLAQIDASGVRSFMPAMSEPFGWFQDIPTPPLSQYCPTPLPSPGTLCGEEWHTKVLNNQYQPSIFADAQLYQLRMGVMNDLSKHPEWASCNTLYQNFQNGYAGSTLQKLSQGETAKASLFALQSSQVSNYLNKYENMRAKSEYVAKLDKQRQSGSPISVAVYAQKQSEYLQAKAEFEQYNALMLSQQTGISTAAKTANETINSSAIWEVNQKEVNQVNFLMTKEHRLPTKWEEESLLSIAQQCPLSGGDAVYEARILLGNRHDVEYNDEKSCEGEKDQEGVKGRASLTSESSKLGIYPNPATDYLLLDAYIGKDMQLVDALGRVVLRQKIDVPLVNISQVQRGVYQLCIWDENTRIVCNSIVISEK